MANVLVHDCLAEFSSGVRGGGGGGGRRGAAMKGTISIRIIHGIHEEGDIERDIVKGHQGASCYSILQHQSSPSPTCQVMIIM